MRSDLSTAANHYAEAVIDLAMKEGGEATADAILKDIINMNKMMRDNREVHLLLTHPSIPAETKHMLLDQVFKSTFKDLTMRMLGLLLDKRRFSLLPFIETRYHELLNKRKNILSASLVCAEKLNDKSVADIKARLTEHLGRKLELEVNVDPSLIGGVVLRLGDQVIDGSLKGKLRNLERALLSV